MVEGSEFADIAGTSKFLEPRRILVHDVKQLCVWQQGVLFL